jgi:hypothetical protein
MVEAVWVWVFVFTLSWPGGSIQLPISFDTPDKCERARQAVQLHAHLRPDLIVPGSGIGICDRQTLPSVHIKLMPPSPQIVP